MNLHDLTISAARRIADRSMLISQRYPSDPLAAENAFATELLCTSLAEGQKKGSCVICNDPLPDAGRGPTCATCALIQMEPMETCHVS